VKALLAIWKLITFSVGLYMGAFAMATLFMFIFALSNSIADLRWEKDIDMKIKELQYEKLLSEVKK